jgi:hypothetical protein
MQEWLEAVQQRGAVVAKLFEDLLAREPSSLLVEVGSPLDDIIMPYLRHAIASGTRPPVVELVRMIRGSRCPAADALECWLAMRPNSDVTYDDLAQFGYAAGLLLEAHEHGMTIEVDNPSEEPIFRAASRVIRRTRGEQLPVWKANVMAVYPHEQTVEAREGVLDWRATGKSRRSGPMMRRVMRQYGC